jgi:hypothetical protein
MSPEAWNDVVEGVVGTLGRNKAREFVPSRFISQYGTIPDASKDVLFGPKGNGGIRQGLDDILTVSNKFGEMNEFSNPSGTAQVAAGIAMMLNPFGLMPGSYAAAKVLSKVLSEPRTSAPAGRVLSSYASDLKRAIDPTSPQSATQAALRSFMIAIGKKPQMAASDRDERKKRASGGKIGKEDYPAKRLTRMERAANRAREALALESEHLMNKPDEHIANALRIAENK